VPGAEVYAARHLLDVVQQFLPAGGASATEPPTEPGPGWVRLQGQAPSAPATYPDLADVKGQAAARRALEIAAAGGHSLLMVGPPGSGKSMLAQRLAGLLPPMSVDEALEAAAIASLAGRFELARWSQRPTAQPHHTASAVALVGGGSPPRPGEISLAHQGVLFLDGRVSGPLLDRIDLLVEVPAQGPEALLAAAPGEPSAQVAARAAAARQRMLARQGAPNGALDAASLVASMTLEPQAHSLAQATARQMGWSGRRLHRTLKVARTVADLAASEPVAAAHVAEALQMQRGLGGGR